MTKRRAMLTVGIDYDDSITDPESLAAAMDTLLRTAMSTPGVLDDYGSPSVGEFLAPEAVYTAAIGHRHGTDIYAAWSVAELDAKLAGFCRDWWHEIADADGLPNEPPAGDRECIDLYFQTRQDWGSHSEDLNTDLWSLRSGADDPLGLDSGH